MRSQSTGTEANAVVGTVGSAARLTLITASAASTTPPSTLTDPRLADIVYAVRTLGFRIVKLNTRATGERLATSDFHHHVDTAVWSAFIARGGDLDAIDAFPWGTMVQRKGVPTPIEDALAREALATLRGELLGRQTVYGDTKIRTAGRQNRAMVDGYRWTAWTQSGDGGESRGKSGAVKATTRDPRAQLATEYGAPVEQEQRLQDKTLIQLMDVLRAGLGERDFKWMVERDARGMSVYEQVEEALADDTTYVGPRGIAFWQQCNKDEVRKTGRTDEGYVRYCKTASKINVAIHRARAKARKLLGDQWAELARDVAA